MIFSKVGQVWSLETSTAHDRLGLMRNLMLRWTSGIHKPTALPTQPRAGLLPLLYVVSTGDVEKPVNAQSVP
jgi:hypothetical protein